MGYFTWKDCQDRRRSVGYDKPVYVICLDDTVIEEPSYFGYGIFRDHDIFDLVVDWNRPYLKDLFEKKDPKAFGHELLPVAIAAMESDEAAEKVVREIWKGKDPTFYLVKEWKRNIGIAIACKDEDNESLPYPIKMSATPPKKPYAELKVSYQCQ